MIVVLDTNVIVSSLLSSRGAPAEIVRRWEAEEFEVVTSPVLLKELARALAYDQVTKYFKQPVEQIDAFVKRLRVVAILLEQDNRAMRAGPATGAISLKSMVRLQRADDRLFGATPRRLCRSILMAARPA